MALTKFIPSRSVLAGGLAGLVAWGAVLAAHHYGITIGSDEADYQMALMIATGIGGVVTNFVPDSLKDHARALNVKVEDLAAMIPTAKAEYPAPDAKNGNNADIIRSVQGWKK